MIFVEKTEPNTQIALCEEDKLLLDVTVGGTCSNRSASESL